MLFREIKVSFFIPQEGSFSSSERNKKNPPKINSREAKLNIYLILTLPWNLQYCKTGKLNIYCYECPSGSNWKQSLDIELQVSLA